MTFDWRRLVGGGGLVGVLVLVAASCGERPEEGGLEIVVEARLVATSPTPTLEEIAPYDEALVHHEYVIERVLAGARETGRVRVARWGVLAGKEQESVGEVGSIGTFTLLPLDDVPGIETVRVVDDLPFEPDAPVYLDLSQSLASPDAPAQVRYDYGMNWARRMLTFWRAGHQIRLVVVGNSHAAAAVAARQFFQPENETMPVAVNMSPPGSGMALQCLLVHEYFMKLPKLEWIVWGVSPRIFNERTVPDRRYEIFTGSPGYRYDQTHRDSLLPFDIDAPPVTVGDIKEATGKSYTMWGWSPGRIRKYPLPLDEESEQEILRQCRMDRFVESSELWDEFEATVELVTGRGIKMLLFIPPYHPLVKGAEAADGDGTGHDAYRRIVARLERIASENSLVFFQDIHDGGDHNFPDEEFVDVDHLMEAGALRLTPRLVEIVEANSVRD